MSRILSSDVFRAKATGQTDDEIFILHLVRSKHLTVYLNGSVFNNVTGRWLGYRSDPKWYPVVSMRNNNTCKIYHLLIHRLTWLVFKGDIPLDKELNHKDRNRHNPRLSNLEVCTPVENVKHAHLTYVSPTGEDRHNSIFTNEEVISYRTLSISMTKLEKANLVQCLATKYECTETCINSMLCGKTYTSITGPVRPVNKSAVTESLKSKIIDLKTKGFSMKLIAKELDISASAVRYALTKKRTAEDNAKRRAKRQSQRRSVARRNSSSPRADVAAFGTARNER